MDRLAGCMGETGAYVAFVGNPLGPQPPRLGPHRAPGGGRRRCTRGIQRHRPPRREPRGRGRSPTARPRRSSPRIPRSPAFQGSSAVDVAGIGRAVREAGRQATTCVMGTSSPATVGDLLDDGSVDRIFLWDPAIAGQAQLKLALRVLRGQAVRPGLDLHLPGYRDLRRISGTPHALHGDALIDVDLSNAADYPF